MLTGIDLDENVLLSTEKICFTAVAVFRIWQNCIYFFKPGLLQRGPVVDNVIRTIHDEVVCSAYTHKSTSQNKWCINRWNTYQG